MSPKKKPAGTGTETSTASSSSSAPFNPTGRGIGCWGPDCGFRLFVDHGYDTTSHPFFKHKPTAAANKMSTMTDSEGATMTTRIPHTVLHTAALDRPYSTGPGWGLGHGRIDSPFAVSPAAVFDSDPHAHMHDFLHWAKLMAGPFTLFLCVFFVASIFFWRVYSYRGCELDLEDCNPAIRWWKGLWESKGKAVEDREKRFEKEREGEGEGRRMEYKVQTGA